MSYSFNSQTDRLQLRYTLSSISRVDRMRLVSHAHTGHPVR